MSVHPTPVTPTWTFADRLRKARLLTGMDQREFAAALHVTPSALAAWETERAHPRDIVGLAKDIETLCGISASWMLGLADHAPPSNDGPATQQPRTVTKFRRPRPKSDGKRPRRPGKRRLVTAEAPLCLAS